MVDALLADINTPDGEASIDNLPVTETPAVGVEVMSSSEQEKETSLSDQVSQLRPSAPYIETRSLSQFEQPSSPPQAMWSFPSFQSPHGPDSVKEKLEDLKKNKKPSSRVEENEVLCAELHAKADSIEAVDPTRLADYKRMKEMISKHVLETHELDDCVTVDVVSPESVFKKAAVLCANSLYEFVARVCAQISNVFLTESKKVGASYIPAFITSVQYESPRLVETPEASSQNMERNIELLRAGDIEENPGPPR